MTKPAPAPIPGAGGSAPDESFTINAVPGPIVGAGLPGLIAALGVLLGLAQHRRKQRLSCSVLREALAVFASASCCAFARLVRGNEDNLHFNDLRGTAATRLAAAG